MGRRGAAAQPRDRRRPHRAPDIITGLFRTGTTLLRRLLAADPQNRAPVLWELQSPVDPPGADPMDVHFVRSVNGGASWSAPVRVNDDMLADAWQWFGTMSVAPTGRIDVVWNDTRNTGVAKQSQLFYASSTDGGVTWATLGTGLVVAMVVGLLATLAPALACLPAEHRRGPWSFSIWVSRDRFSTTTTPPLQQSQSNLYRNSRIGPAGSRAPISLT